MDHKEELKKVYNNWGKTYDLDAEHNIAIIKVHPVVLDLLKKEPIKEVGLDLGCGTGILTVQAAEFSKEITGVDYSEGMLEQARRKAGPNSKIKFVQADLSADLRFSDNTFDYILAILFLHHLENIGHLPGNLQDSQTRRFFDF